MANSKQYHYCPIKSVNHGGRRIAIRVCAARARCSAPGSNCYRCRVWEKAAKVQLGRPASLRPGKAVDDGEE
jgi:hypothetical protein